MVKLKLELAKIVASRSLTVVVQSLASSAQSNSITHSSRPCVTMLMLNGAPLVFTDSGVYADLPATLQALEDICLATVRH